MDRRIVLLDVILALIAVTLGYQFYRGWSQFESTHAVALVGPTEEIDATVGPLEELEFTREERDWTATAESNPFSPDRNDVAVVGAVVPVDEGMTTVTDAPPPILIGTMLLGDELVALMGPRDSGTYGPVRVGEALEGWRLLEIDRKTVVVGANGVREDVIMNDPTIAVPRRTTRTAATPRATPVAPNPTPVPPPTPAPQLPTTSAEPGTPSPGPRVVQTPFGPSVIQE